jgi:hypothetical protein
VVNNSPVAEIQTEEEKTQNRSEGGEDLGVGLALPERSL